MTDYLTLVFRDDELESEERLALCRRAAAMAWSHAIHERDQLRAWREHQLEAWEKMPDRPEPGDIMALGNAFLDSPEYTERRHAKQVAALKAELDALDSVRQRLLEERNQALKERDALAAHVERLTDLIDKAAEGNLHPADIAPMIIREKHENSLARRQAKGGE